jgi:tagatose-1,6-bisphosphate aldolase non-catalytic subunit AgaZ/GatZ
VHELGTGLPLGLTLNQVVARLLGRYEQEGWAPTLLGVGPMSALVVRAALAVGRDADCPVMLIASRNQVDSAAFGGGYVEGWTQETFAADIRRLAAAAGFDGLLYICRDHGGPWFRDEEMRAGLPLEQAMANAAESLLADLAAGFHQLHVDPTRDPGGAVAPEDIAARSLELVRTIERVRTERGLPPVSYEIGTDDIRGGLTAEADFAGFLTDLLRRLEAQGLPRPAFVVGQTGTLLKMRDNVGVFDAATARRLAMVAREHGLGFKEHNADYLPDDVLRAHPELGITAANIAPEFGHAETEALLALADRETAAIQGSPGAAIAPSDLRRIVEDQVLSGGRWAKWLRPAEKGTTEADLRVDPARRAEVTIVCGHYTFTDPQVKEARRRLYANARTLGVAADPEREVLHAVTSGIARYVEPLRMEGVTTWLRG